MKTLYSVLFSLFSLSAAAQVPILNSYPSSRATVFIDFDGHYVAGTSWNWGGPFTAQPADLTTAQMAEVYDRVAEDFRIFNVNVTTDSTVYLGAPNRQRIRVIVTPTYSWYGNTAGGVSFVNSFTFGDGTPCFVFSSLLGNTAKKVAEAVSHEAGHTLGLQHQSAYDANCVRNEYHPGIGNGEISWAPIMGMGYYKNVTTWHNGTAVYGCNYYQNDIQIIAGAANNFGLRADDAADTHLVATPITLETTGFANTGLINSAADKDVFQFTLTYPTNVRLSAIPQNVGTNNSGANLDIQVSLLDYKGDTIGQYNPADVLNAGVDSNLNSGTYYMVVEGVPNAYTSDYNSVGFYNLVGSVGVALPIHRLTLSGRSNANVHTLNWVYQADEPVKHIEVQYSKDGTSFESLSQLAADTKTFSWKPLSTTNNLYYRIRVVTVADERAYYSNIFLLRESTTNSEPVQVLNNILTDQLTVNADKEYSFQLTDATGRLLQRGKLVGGTNRVAVNNSQKGLLLLRVQGGNENFTFKLIKQ